MMMLDYKRGGQESWKKWLDNLNYVIYVSNYVIRKLLLN